MIFIKNNTVEEALIEKINESLIERTSNACSTWNLNDVLSYAVGVKVDIDIDEEKKISDYFSDKKNYILNIGNNKTVTILKGDTKVRNGKAVLIFRYQLKMN